MKINGFSHQQLYKTTKNQKIVVIFFCNLIIDDLTGLLNMVEQKCETP